MKKEVTKHGFQSWASEEETITGRKYKNSKSMPSLEKVSIEMRVGGNPWKIIDLGDGRLDFCKKHSRFLQKTLEIFAKWYMKDFTP